MVIAVNLNLTDRNLLLGERKIKLKIIGFQHAFLNSESLTINKKILCQVVDFQGHRNILGTHRNTLEITKEPEISTRADCIIGVRATKGCCDLEPQLVQAIKSGKRIEFLLSVASTKFRFYGFGSPNLQLADEREMVFRKSDFASPRTLAIRCDAAAIDVPRSMIKSLQDPNSVGTLEITIINEQKLMPISIPPIEFQ